MSKKLNNITIGRGNGIVFIADKVLDVSLVNDDTIQIKLPPQDEHPCKFAFRWNFGSRTR